MLKQIFLLWIRLFLYIIAVSYLISLRWEEFRPKNLYVYIIGSLVLAVIYTMIRRNRQNTSG